MPADPIDLNFERSFRQQLGRTIACCPPGDISSTFLVDVSFSRDEYRVIDRFTCAGWLPNTSRTADGVLTFDSVRKADDHSVVYRLHDDPRLASLPKAPAEVLALLEGDAP